jgi:hypothetical protein
MFSSRRSRSALRAQNGRGRLRTTPAAPGAVFVGCQPEKDNLYWLLFSSVPCLVADNAGYQGWLQLKEELADYAGGPTGYYSIQDMRELNPGDTAERRFKSLAFFDYDRRGVIQGSLHRYETPAAVSYLDSRDEEGTMYVMGTLEGTPPERVTIDLNRTYSFLCAHSIFYNCPLVLTTRIDADLNYGEKYPPLFSSTKP